jgi:hypothetical protein
MTSMLARHTHLFLALLLLCVGAAQVGAASGAGAIKHVITLMMENHSFNNLLGWLPGIGDVLPSDYNLLNTSDPNSPKLFASDGAPFCAMADLLHDFVDVQEQVFGGAATAANMGGFVHNYAAHGGTAAVPMACFTPQQLPVISALCSSFTCATRFHSSIPGPTGPNRMMLHAATTTGYDGGQFDIGPFHMHARTIYEDLQADGRTWRIHWQDFTTAHAITPLSASPNTSAYITRDVAFTKFFDALERGTLPDYTLLVPALGPLNTSSGSQAPNSQHPAYDIRHGEELIKQVKVKKPAKKLTRLPQHCHSPPSRKPLTLTSGVRPPAPQQPLERHAPHPHLRRTRRVLGQAATAHPRRQPLCHLHLLALPLPVRSPWRSCAHCVGQQVQPPPPRLHPVRDRQHPCHNTRNLRPQRATPQPPRCCSQHLHVHAGRRSR